jgi:hypothetical protein
MEPVTIVVVSGFLGGLVIALFVLWSNRVRHTGSTTDAFSREPLSSDVINIAHIRVAGIGGLGLVAMALNVAIFIPRIGIPIGLGLVLGAVFAGVLILRRRRQGPMPSSGRQAGANTTLSIDTAPLPVDAQLHDPSKGPTQDMTGVPTVASRLA